MGVLWAFCGRGLVLKDGFEGGGEFGLSGDFFGELSEDGRAVVVTAGAKAGIAVENEGGRERSGGSKGGSGSGIGGGGVGCREAVVNEGREHLLIAEVGLEVLVGCGARVSETTKEIKAVGGGLCGKVRVLQQEFGIEGSCSHLLTMDRLGTVYVFCVTLCYVTVWLCCKFALPECRGLASGYSLPGVLTAHFAA